MSSEHDGEISSDSESDCELHAVRIIGDKKEYTFHKFRCIALAAVIIILIAACISGIYIYNAEVEDINANETDYILPNTTLTIVSNNDTLIKGEFMIDREIKYNFVSISNSSVEYIEFQQISQSITHQEWNGFKIYHLNGKQLTIELINIKNKPYTITMYSKNNMSAAEVQLLELFLGNVLCEHFVELSVKLGSMDYSGQQTHVIEDIHRFAQWIWTVALDNPNIDNSQWVDLTEEFEKVNAMTSGSLDNTYEASSSRRLFQNGNCGAPYKYCNNECHGRCGKGCRCWRWVCGTCDCWEGCRIHDGICCINGYMSYCCLNIFWVTCDGSKSCYDY